MANKSAWLMSVGLAAAIISSCISTSPRAAGLNGEWEKHISPAIVYLKVNGLPHREYLDAAQASPRYAMILKQGETYRFRCESFWAAEFNLFANDEVTLAASDRRRIGRQTVMDWTCPVSGTYYWELNCLSPPCSGIYEIEVRRINR